MNGEDEEYDDDLYQYDDDNNNTIITDENNNFMNPLHKSSLLVTDGGIRNALLNSLSNMKFMKFKKKNLFYPEKMTTCSFQQPFDEDIYPMNTYPRGKLIILNYSNFQNPNFQNFPRIGSEKDVERLKFVFLKLGFIVELLENMTTSETVAMVTESVNNNNEKLSCYFLAILSHGIENQFSTTDGSMELTKITALFQKPKLAGIPKIFLIQACRGQVPMESYDGYEKNNYDESSSSYNFVSLPTEEDVVYAFATAFGFRSFRNIAKGSWFIQTMCDVIVENASKMDFLRMLTKVNAKISLRKSNTKDDLSKAKLQIGSFVSHLTKELYFYPLHAF